MTRFFPRAVATAALAALAVAGADAAACWVKQPLSALVRGADVIAVGRVTAVERAPGEQPYELDVATIRVRRLVAGHALVRRLFGQTRAIELGFPSVNNRLRVSTDLRYERGDAGVWLLTLDDGVLRARRPGSLQPRERLEEIRALVEAERADDPADTRAAPATLEPPPPALHIERRR